jgi:hypothetical protein
MNYSVPVEELLDAVRPWDGTVPDRVYHGTTEDFEAFDFERCSGIVWFQATFEGAAAFARSRAKDFPGVPRVITCRLDVRQWAHFLDETSLRLLGGRILRGDLSRSRAFPAVAAALLDRGYDGVTDLGGNAMRTPPFALGVFRADAIVDLSSAPVAE